MDQHHSTNAHLHQSYESSKVPAHASEASCSSPVPGFEQCLQPFLQGQPYWPVALLSICADIQCDLTPWVKGMLKVITARVLKCVRRIDQEK